jgi:hypothetical protein
VRDTPRTDPDRHSLVHPVHISDDWRRSALQDMDGVYAVAEASDPLTNANVRVHENGCFWLGEAVCATAVPSIAVGTP